MRHHRFSAAAESPAAAHVVAIAIIIAFACAVWMPPSTARAAELPDGVATRSRAKADTIPADWLTSPRVIVLEIIVEATVEEVLSGEALAAQNREWGLPENAPPHLMFWSADLVNHLAQQQVERLRCEPPPTSESIEPENGNNILHWDFSPQLAAGKTFTMRRVYRMTLNAFDPGLADGPTSATSARDAGGGDAAGYDPWNRDVMLNTKSEPFNELTPSIRRAALEAVDGATTPVAMARAAFDWTRARMDYAYPPPGGRGATVALREGKGDCGQYADLFISLCRAVGIPARFAGGFGVGAPGKDGAVAVGSHAWAEFMLPDGRWVPADPSREGEDHFARLLDNAHITASVGRNILLPNAPAWATSKFSDVENGRTEFMQTVTEVSHGVKSNVRIQRRLLDPKTWAPGAAK